METSTVDNQIDEIIKDNKIFRFASELQGTTDSERKKQLKTIIHVLQGAQYENSHQKIVEMYDDIDKHIYEQRWVKLNKEQKKFKINEFLNETIKDQDNKNIIKTEMNELIDKNKLRTIKDVEYDSKTSKIINIFILKNIDGKFIIDKKKK
jgi:hypothetical protein